jgi:hypothetical protein
MKTKLESKIGVQRNGMPFWTSSVPAFNLDKKKTKKELKQKKIK